MALIQKGKQNNIKRCFNQSEGENITCLKPLDQSFTNKTGRSSYRYNHLVLQQPKIYQSMEPQALNIAMQTKSKLVPKDSIKNHQNNTQARRLKRHKMVPNQNRLTEWLYKMCHPNQKNRPLCR